MTRQLYDTPLASPEAWVGVWFRMRSGPSTKGVTVTISRWHRVRSIDGDRIDTMCRPTWRKPWPDGSARMEIARPRPWTSLPGDLCPKCGAEPVAAEVEVPEAMVDEIARKVADILAGRPLETDA